MGNRMTLLFDEVEATTRSSNTRATSTNRRYCLIEGLEMPPPTYTTPVMPGESPLSVVMRGQNQYLVSLDDAQWGIPLPNESGVMLSPFVADPEYALEHYHRTTTNSDFLHAVPYSTPLREEGSRTTVSSSIPGGSYEDLLDDVYSQMDSSLEASYIDLFRLHMDEHDPRPVPGAHGYILCDSLYQSSLNTYDFTLGGYSRSGNEILFVRGWGPYPTWVNRLGHLELDGPFVTGAYDPSIRAYSVECSYEWRYDLTGVEWYRTG